MKKERKIIGITISVIFMAFIVIGCSNSFDKKFEQGKKQIEEGKYDEAKSIFDELLGKADGEDESAVKEYSDLANELIKSEEAYKAAEEYLKNNDLVNCIKNLKLVIEKDKKNYEVAQNKIAEVSNKYADEIKTKVDELKSSGHFDEAIVTITDAKNICSNEKFDTLITEVETEKNKIEQQKSNLQKAIESGKVTTSANASEAVKAKTKEIKEKVNAEINARTEKYKNIGN